MSFHNAHDLINDIKDKCSDVLQRDCGLNSADAQTAAEAVANHIKKDWQGQQIYFPKCLELDISKRDLDLYNKFDGTNHPELAHEFKVSVQWVYKVVKYVRAKEIAEKQVDAFYDEELQGNTSRRKA